MYINRRVFIKIISFSIALIGIFTTLSIQNKTSADAMSCRLSTCYASDLDQLSEHLSNIETALLKCTYCGTSYQLTKNATKVWGEAMAAKVNVDNLPGYDDKLSSVSEFLSQTGDYMYCSMLNAIRGSFLTDDDIETITELANNASYLRERINAICNSARLGEISYDTVLVSYSDYDESDHDGFVSGELVSSADQVSGYPELIYDGPFSDHIEKMESVFLKNKAEITRSDAEDIICDIFGTDESNVRYQYDNNTTVAEYVFSIDNKTIAISKLGGYLSRIVSSDIIAESNMDENEAVEKAKEFLSSVGFDGMADSYYYTSDNETTVNFVYKDNDVKIYPDMIKVTVSLQDGSITGFESIGYLMAHCTDRNLSVSISENEAKSKVSKNLNITASSIAIIPTDGKNEVLCYEFQTETNSGNRVLVYVNAIDGTEEMMQILIETEKGTLSA